MTEHSTVAEPAPANDRDFLTYAGAPIRTSYGHEVRVQESSAADGPHVWLFIGDSPTMASHDPHLNLEQAIAVHAALGQFIDGVPERWTDGQAMLDEAKRNVLGDSAED
ncbi:hypothetical protein [Streptomyces sp. NPDC058466]|uniref:hypothetical protein n=1 Tax=Streptomyces sp. NPDC058466 TaxID=3346512 RepID=UPI0036654C2A